ncbi:unnamed protein product [Kuraishia capsulata CBS 1993]|uniref:HhH-GPD domain-containing protein n=1 Tax=Kuraishia capsulata CBS 1993 TaxID=1382522 RepID=W6MUL0_9ASCO|nr:uncharacterized protein KUCA_T00005355001 [Kuraishia capsulata CBS 1993]CDK29367.1 unnamed protein product [Kuraishia capsulata CBS 1993]
MANRILRSKSKNLVIPDVASVKLETVKTVKPRARKAKTIDDEAKIPITIKKVKPLPVELFEGELDYFRAAGPLSSELPPVFVKTHDVECIKALGAVLAKDPTLFPTVISQNFSVFQIADIELANQRRDDDNAYFEKLADGILSQQVSGKAAESIKRKLTFTLTGVEPQPGKQFSTPDAKTVLDATFETLRGCGLSTRKAEYMQGLAAMFVSGELSASYFNSASDEEISKKLISIRGIGPWSVTMFMIFQLRRLDYFDIRDLGVLRGGSRYLLDRPTLFEEVKSKHVLAKRTAHLINKKNVKWTAVDEGYVEFVAAQFAPYRSILMFLFWRLSGVNINVLES